ncbi:MAG: hypothetical protein QOK15_2505 [Nocardioidaceae bacterium]|nr:hypothetical protein [Nocardioidaceae bacterium]
MSNDERKGISWVQVTSAALAAVSSAVVLSTLGVAGTMIGAALGSVTASIGAAVYGRTIDASRQQVAAQAVALRRVTRARLQVDDAVLAMRHGGAGSDTGVVRARAKLSEAEQDLQDAEEHAEARSAAGAPLDETAGATTVNKGADALMHPGAGKGLPWKRIALVAAAVFVVAMIAISGFELITGRAVSSYTGGSDSSTGSTVPGLAGGGHKPTPTPSTTPSQQPSPSSVAPSPTASSSPTSTPSTAPTPTPSPTQSPLPSGSVSPSPTVPVG